MFKRQRLSEAAPGGLVTSTGSGLFKVRIISSGVGSSGVYPASTIRDAVERHVWAAGTQVYLDHPGMSESDDRPERSLRDLVGVLESDAELAELDDGTVAADATVKVYAPYRELLTEMAADIGMSIRATADIAPGEADGHRGQVVWRIHEAISVDFVTKAGRGGKVLEVLEAARGQVVEASTSDRRDQLQRAIRTAITGWAYLVDFDETRLLAWYESDGDDGTSRTWEQGFMPALDDMSVTLTGTPVEVRPVTTFHPVGQTGSIGESSPATTTKEKHMEITEAKYAELTATADRVTALEAELAAEKQRAEAAEAEARKVTHDAYTVQVAAALEASTLPTAARQRVAATLALAEGADVPADSAAVIESAVKAESDYLASVAPAPRKGLGFGAATSTTSESYTNAWGRTITKEA